jgi:hypothetical protein
VVYDRRLETDEGTVAAEFGVSGKLADDDLVLYDRETDSEYKQSTGTGIAGPLEGTRLSPVPSSLSSYEQFRETHPDGLVLQQPGGASEAAGPGPEPTEIDYDDAPYEEYFEQEGFGVDALHGEESRDWNRADLDPKTVVLALERDGDAVGIPLPRLEAAGGVAVVSVGGTSVVAIGTAAGLFAYEAPPEIDESTAVTAMDEAKRFRTAGTVWDSYTGRSEEDDRQLERVPLRRLFAFTWQDDHGSDAFWSG